MLFWLFHTMKAFLAAAGAAAAFATLGAWTRGAVQGRAAIVESGGEMEVSVCEKDSPEESRRK